MVIAKEEYDGKSLKVKFDFKKYAEENNCADEIRSRLEVMRYPMLTFLSDYFGLNEKLEIRRRHHFDWTNKGRKFSIKTNEKDLTLKIQMTSPKNLTSEELLNADNLNLFIETGKHPIYSL